jgi:spore maturation protein SpmB
MALLKILEKIGIIKLMTKLLEPVLKLLGMGREAAPLTIIGMTLGIGYGGALLIREAQSGAVSKRDIFAAFVMLGLCHSLFEDTLVMMLLGGHVSGVLWGRLLFSLLITFLLGLLVSRLPQAVFERYLVRRTIADQASQKEVNCC